MVQLAYFQINYPFAFSSFLVKSTAPTIALNNSNDDNSNGNMNGPNNSLPRFSTNPKPGFFNTNGLVMATDFNEPIKVTTKQPPATIPIIFSNADLLGSFSLLRFSNISTKRKSTMIAPM